MNKGGHQTLEGVLFVAMLYVGAACCLLLPLFEQAGNLEFMVGGASARMSSDDPALPAMARQGQWESAYLRATYRTKSGDMPVPRIHAEGSVLQQLARGESIAVEYLIHHPERYRLVGSGKPMSWLWLGLGLVVLTIARLAHRLLRRETASAAGD